MKVEIPVNTTALIGFPTTKLNSITEEGKSIQSIKEIKFEKEDDNRVYFTVGSGNYTFKMSL